MFLKKLEINGFKSFANKTTLDFLPTYISAQSVAGGADSENGNNIGIAAIVGPNGSGKSNIADAIRWVMGEQSLKNLRGKKSEDVIFAGSGKKAKLGSASASLFFDNSDKKIPLDFEEISITRKIYRSGESEYIINGSRVRLQDVVDLLAKAGIGKESYSIVNQGMADAILNATPLERRVLIEEAAGVKQYQIKKERAIRKLDSTKENLEKAKSLAEEIKPHLKMLKRQAEKAAQSKEISEELKEKQNILFSFLWNNFQREKANFAEEKNQIGAKMMNMQREVDKISDELSKESKENIRNEKLEELEKELSSKKSVLSGLERDLVVTEGRMEIEKEKQKSLAIMEEIRVKSISIDLPYIKKEIEAIRLEQEKLVEKISQVKNLEELTEVKILADNIKSKLLELKQDVEKGKKEEEIKSEKSERKNDFSGVIEGMQKKTAEFREEIKRIEDEIIKIQNEIQQEVVNDRERRKKFFELERVLRTKQDELGKLKDEFSEAKISLAKTEVREEDLRAEILRELKTTPEEMKMEAKEDADKLSLERDISRLKMQMEQIGGIDPLVTEEYQETNARYEFLMKESEDLEKAIVSLREIIKEMNKKIDESFHSTFDEINKEFSKYFRIIFGGGNANLMKVKIRRQKSKSEDAEENVADESGGEEINELSQKEEKEDIGIDISATPPGKRISNLSMLSGGERSLTSLALLFSIISHNPPPFSVLDEVEAALDEANSRRFSRILQELSHNTQFVIITHNRESMRNASMLYGVTMGEDGISKLLSVRLDQIGQGGKILSGK